MTQPSPAIPLLGGDLVRIFLRAQQELALIDVREEDPHAQGHPLFAANLPLSRLELDAYRCLPRRDVLVVVLDGGEGLAELAAQKLLALGYSRVSVLDGGVAGWVAAGGELFHDVNVPSKAFGELVESVAHTPSLTAQQVKALIDADADLVIVDARRYDEYHTMSIPTSTSVPGAELVLRINELAPRPETAVIVNCAGRTRSLIGTQSLVNAGRSKVAALRNGTIGWTLAGYELERGQERRCGEVSEAHQRQAAAAARRVADRAGVIRSTMNLLIRWRAEVARTTYFFDVRSPEEYRQAHLPGFINAPGGQLVQETEMFAPVRNARIVLFDTDGVRANMTASWLAQMAWEVSVVDSTPPAQLSVSGAGARELPPLPDVALVAAAELARWLATAGTTLVIDLGASATYRKQHIPGAWFAIRSQLGAALKKLPAAQRLVLTSNDGVLAHFAAAELQALTAAPVFVLHGGTDAWQAAGLTLESNTHNFAAEPIDRYRRPYEGTDNPREAMEAYLEWEYGLVEQLRRDGTHGFRVLAPEKPADNSLAQADGIRLAIV